MPTLPIWQNAPHWRNAHLLAAKCGKVRQVYNKLGGLRANWSERSKSQTPPRICIFKTGYCATSLAISHLLQNRRISLSINIGIGLKPNTLWLCFISSPFKINPMFWHKNIGPCVVIIIDSYNVTTHKHCSFLQYIVNSRGLRYEFCNKESKQQTETNCAMTGMVAQITFLLNLT